jgi:hypothetical protein
MQDAEPLQKLKQVEQNAWLIFSDAKDLKARLERLAPLREQPGHR